MDAGFGLRLFCDLAPGLDPECVFRFEEDAWSMSVQPFGALLFAGYSVLWVLLLPLWDER